MQKFSWWNGCLSQIPTGKLQLPVVQPRDWDQKGFSKKVSGTYNKSWLWVGVMLKDWLFLSKTLQAFIPIVLFTCACASTMCNTVWAINKHAVATFHAIWFSTWPLRKGSFDSATIDFSTSWFLLIMLACFLRLSSCPASFPYVFRVGTAWNGDLWSFSGFTSLMPSASVAQVSWHFHLLGMREPELHVFRFCHFRPMDGLTTFVPGRLPGWWMSTMERSWKRQSLCHNHSFTPASLKL